MGTATISISTLRAESELGASWNVAKSVPGWLRKPLILWVFPSIFKKLNDSLTNERLGALTAEEALDLYEPFSRLHEAGQDVLKSVESKPWLGRSVLKPWCNQMSKELDALENIVEALAWGSDAGLRDLIDSATQELPRTAAGLSQE